MPHNERGIEKPPRRATANTKHHSLTLYRDPDALFTDLREAISRAQQRVWLETYIYRDDHMGRGFAELMVDAVKRGLDVRLLYDPQGSRGTNPDFFAQLRAQGVSVEAYRPLRFARYRWTYWPRDHGRIIVIDDASYTGGINWGAEWLPLHEGGEAWHDISVGLRGPCVQDFATVFLRRWREATTLPKVADHVSSDGDADVEFIADSPASRSIVLERLCHAIACAKRRVLIENSYCVPPRQLFRALVAAVKRGVEVRLLMPGKSDLPSVQNTTRGEYAHWIERGIDIYEYQPTVMHSKFAVIDDAWGTVGSFNAMMPGVWWANETNVIVRDPAFARELVVQFEYDVARSHRVDGVWLARRSLANRFRDKFFAWTYRLIEAIGTLLVALVSAFRHTPKNYSAYYETSTH